jgi:hypothetical protein
VSRKAVVLLWLFGYIETVSHASSSRIIEIIENERIWRAISVKRVFKFMEASVVVVKVLFPSFCEVCDPH